jgi:RNA recognition motif-containing protein
MTLYVTNLPTGVNVEAITDLFARFGRVAGVDVWEGIGDFAGQRAYVVELHDGGAAAVRELNGLKFRGRLMWVSESRPWDPA